MKTPEEQKQTVENIIHLIALNNISFKEQARIIRAIARDVIYMNQDKVINERIYKELIILADKLGEL